MQSHFVSDEENGCRVSAVIPVYNVERYLERCIQSCLSQTKPFFEIVLVDDGSTDSSGEICDRFAKEHLQIKVIHQDNQGLSGARNRGIEESSGDCLSFIDSDDWLSPFFLETLSGLLVESEADISVCPLIRVTDEKDYQKKTAMFPAPQVACFTADEYMDIMLRVHSNRCVHYACGKVFKKSVIEKEHFPIGLLNEDVEGFFKALLSAHVVVETSEPLYCYFVNEESITGAEFGENYACLPLVWSRVLEIAKERSPELVGKVEYNYKRTSLTILCDLLLHGNKSTDLSYENLRRESQSKLRRDLPFLLSSPMVPNRKILSVILAFFYSPIRFAMRHARKKAR